MRLHKALTRRGAASRALAALRLMFDSVYCEELAMGLWKRRMAWVRERAAEVPPGARVLDVGAGTTPYREDFAHTDYVTQDLAQTPDVEYGQIDIVSDLASIPLPDESVDVIVCSEVFEHVPRPLEALAEIARLLRPGGTLIFTAPLGSAQHQQPYHFYGGYTRWWYERFFPENGLEIQTLQPNGGIFAHVAEMLWQTRSYVLGPLVKGGPASRLFARVAQVLGYNLPALLLWHFERRILVEDFTTCFMCQASKAGGDPTGIGVG